MVCIADCIFLFFYRLALPTDRARPVHSLFAYSTILHSALHPLPFLLTLLLLYSFTILFAPETHFYSSFVAPVCLIHIGTRFISPARRLFHPPSRCLARFYRRSTNDACVSLPIVWLVVIGTRHLFPVGCGGYRRSLALPLLAMNGRCCSRSR